MGFVRSVSLTFLAQIACQILTIATGFLLLPLMDPAVKGPFDWILQTPPLLMALGNLGFATAITYLGGAGIFSVERLGRFGMALGFLVGCTLAILAAPLYIAYRVGGAPVWLLFAALTIVPVMLMRSYLNTTLLISDRIGRYNIVEVALPAGFLLLFGGAVLLTGAFSGDQLVIVGVLSRVGACLLSLVFVLAFVSKLYPLRPRLDRVVLQRGWQQARWAYGVSAATELNSRFGFLVLFPHLLRLSAPSEGLAQVHVDTALGLFGVALTFAEVLRNIPLAVEPILFRQVAGSREEWRKLTPQVCRNLLLLSLVAAASIAAIAPLVLDLLNPDYRSSLRSLWVLLPGVSLLSVAKTLHADLMGRGRMDLVFWNTLLSFLVMTGLNILWVPSYGIVGMALAMSGAYLLQALGALFLYRFVVGASILSTIVFQKQDLKLYRELISRSISRLRGGGGAD